MCQVICGCDLLKNIYLCGINNNVSYIDTGENQVVICLKISTFVVSTTTYNPYKTFDFQL